MFPPRAAEEIASTGRGFVQEMRQKGVVTLPMQKSIKSPLIFLVVTFLKSLVSIVNQVLSCPPSTALSRGWQCVVS